ncbi:MAG TPA: hypothetical protein VFG69_02930, partial [Nannocystaceae bacterium]|nr:hypothetical protein [Nannocystaceae bacterium]
MELDVGQAVLEHGDHLRRGGGPDAQVDAALGPRLGTDVSAPLELRRRRARSIVGSSHGVRRQTANRAPLRKSIAQKGGLARHCAPGEGSRHPLSLQSTERPALRDHLPKGRIADDGEMLERFLAWVDASGLQPYPAQEEALLELMAGRHVILATPTGSGKSLVALALH